jgi:hypothetical protein
LRLEPYVKFAIGGGTLLVAGARGVHRGDYGICGGGDGEPDQWDAASIDQTSIEIPDSAMIARAI